MLLLFDKLPSKIFAPLASQNREFYAALLLQLYGNAFAASGDTPRESMIVQEIGDFIASVDRTNLAFDPGHDKEIDTEDEKPARKRRVKLKMPKGQDTRRNAAYRILVKTGWFVVLRDRYRKLVEFSPEGRLLLKELHRIATGNARSYGGAVLNVLGNLEKAVEDPDVRSEGIRNAANFSWDFLQHIKTLTVQMHRVEESIVRQDIIKTFFKTFFDDYVSKHVVTDFKNLRTSNNPFRLRSKILDIIHTIYNNELLLSRLTRAYIKEGRADDPETARTVIMRELGEIQQTFEQVDYYLDAIRDTDARINERVRTVIRYMGRRDGIGLQSTLRSAMSELGACSLGEGDEVQVNPRIIDFGTFVHEGAAYLTRVPRRKAERAKPRNLKPDPAEVAFDAAKKDFMLKMFVDGNKMGEFLERVMGHRASMRAEDIKIENIEDYAMFQRLNEADCISDSMLADRFSVERHDDMTSNKWIETSRFTIHRIRPEDRK